MTTTNTADHFFAALPLARSHRPGVHVVALALDLVAPLAGHTFRALCCWCIEHAERAIEDEIPCARLRVGGECERCPAMGRDVLLALVPAAAR